MNDVLGFEYDLASIICFRHQALPAWYIRMPIHRSQEIQNPGN